jgi:(p)ppGpp synthase/HD superfamily hydrolase
MTPPRPEPAVAAVQPPDPAPAFIFTSSTVSAAYLTARDAHGGPGHGETKLSHPVAVAELLGSRGFDEEMVSAALLHDTVEDTALDLERIEDLFGHEIAGLVAGLTEDARIARYPARKAEARTRAVRDRRVATIYAADKLANTTRLLEGTGPIEGERLDHYVKTLRLFSEQSPELPFLTELAADLTRLIDRDVPLISG